MRRTPKSLADSGVKPPVVKGKQEFIPRSDLTFKVLDRLTIEDTDMYQSLLNGCLVRNCIFRDVNLSRCDLEQIQFVNCVFSNVSFCNVELNSGRVTSCTFEKCNFDSALISDTNWDQCSIENCRFHQAVIHSSEFVKCRFFNTSLRGSSVQLNSFRKTDFKKIVFGDCTFSNQLLIGCTYSDVKVNIESIGSMFGVTQSDILSFGLVYLGQEVVDTANAEAFLSSLERDYELRQWYFQREVLRLNFGRIPTTSGLTQCLDAMLWPDSIGAPIKTNDVLFFEKIILELYSKKAFPGINAILLPAELGEFLRKNNFDRATPVDVRALYQLRGQLQGLLQKMLESLNNDLRNFTEKEKPINILLSFDNKPHNELKPFFDTIVRSSNFHVRKPTSVLKEISGSYFVYLETTLLTLAAFQIALWLLNGCIAQVIELKSRFEVVTRKRSPKVIEERVLLAEQIVPRWMAVTVQGIFNKLTSSSYDIEELAEDFSKSNLKSISNVPLQKQKRTKRTSKS